MIGGRILVVEDDFLVAQQIAGLLSEAGSEVVGASAPCSSGSEAADDTWLC
jgi:DNA-binding response OmpR family regulator